MFEPAQRLGIPVICDLYTDPREEEHTTDSWVVTPMPGIVGALKQSLNTNPLIPMGTPDPYLPPTH